MEYPLERRQTITTWAECFAGFQNVNVIVKRQRLIFYSAGSLLAICLLGSSFDVAREMNPFCSGFLAIGCLLVGMPIHILSRFLFTPDHKTLILWMGLLSCIFTVPAWVAALGSASAGLTIIAEAKNHPQQLLADEESRIGIVLVSSFSGFLMQCAFVAAAMESSDRVRRIAIIGAISSLISFGTAVSIGLDIQVALEHQTNRITTAYIQQSKSFRKLPRLA